MHTRKVTLEQLIDSAPEGKTLHTLRNTGLISTADAGGEPVVFELKYGGDDSDQQAIYTFLVAQITSVENAKGVTLPKRWIYQYGNERWLKEEIADAVKAFYQKIAPV